MIEWVSSPQSDLTSLNNVISEIDPLYIQTQQQEEFADEKRKWNSDDRRIAQYLGIAVDDVKSVDEDDEEDANGALKENAKALKDSDHVVVKIDDRTFYTNRGTLTQVKGSLIALSKYTSPLYTRPVDY